MTKLHATRIGAHALRYLSGESRTGSVVSVFRYGFNVQFDEDEYARLISFQTQDVPLHPWAIEVPGTPPLLQAKLACFTEGKYIRFSSSLIIGFAGAINDKLQIQPWSKRGALQALSNRRLVDSCVKASRPSANPIQLEEELLTILLCEKSRDDAQVFVELIGQGCGATPAGDDMLLGMLASLMAQAAASDCARLQLATLHRGIRAVDLFKRTTCTSAQMLNAGLAGSFPEPLCLLAASLQDTKALDRDLHQSINRVLSLGSSSGRFLLMGFVSALQRERDAAIALG